MAINDDDNLHIILRSGPNFFIRWGGLMVVSFLMLVFCLLFLFKVDDNVIGHVYSYSKTFNEIKLYASIPKINKDLLKNRELDLKSITNNEHDVKILEISFIDSNDITIDLPIKIEKKLHKYYITSSKEIIIIINNNSFLNIMARK